jgi:YhcH/YjgK/YiaL family protein
MISDRLENAFIYKCLSPNMAKAIEFLQTADLKNLANGKHAIEGDNVIASINEYQTKMPDQAKWEAHKQYIDIQYLIEGSESMGYSQLSEMVEIEDYIIEKDVAFFSGAGNYLKLQAPMFVIFYPHDVHRPSLMIGESKLVKKLVIKVKV